MLLVVWILKLPFRIIAGVLSESPEEYPEDPVDYPDDPFETTTSPSFQLSPAPDESAETQNAEQSRRFAQMEKRQMETTRQMEKRQVEAARHQAKVREDDSRREEQENRRKKLLEESRKRAEHEAERKRLVEERQRRTKENELRRKTFKVQFRLHNRMHKTILTADNRSSALDMARQQWPDAINIHVDPS